MTIAEQPIRLAAIDLPVGEPLVLAAESAAAVAAHWAEATAANPRLWNGPAFLFETPTIDGDRLRAQARPTDYATLLFSLRRGFPRPDLFHVFPVAAVTGSDGRLLVGRQGAGTANGGLTYPPSGSFDAEDVVAGRIDPLANMRRELAEEIGLDLGRFRADPQWWAIASGTGRLALTLRHRAEAPASVLAAAIAAAGHDDPHDEIERVGFVAFDDPLALGATVPYVPRLLALYAAEDRAASEVDHRHPGRKEAP